MSTGRADYDQLIKVQSLAPGEPTFLLRARDAVAAAAVRAWASLAYEAGAPTEALELALQQADAMEAWPDKKTPNGPDLTAAQAKQLRYQFDRRAWNSRDAKPDVGLMMAEQLGQAAVIGKLRPLLSDLLARTTWLDDGTVAYDPPRTEGGSPDPDSCPLLALYRLIGRDPASWPAAKAEATDA